VRPRRGPPAAHLLGTLADLDRALVAALPEHPKSAVLTPLPRIGQVNPAQVLAVVSPILDRAADVEQAAASPVTKQSDKASLVHFRWAANTRARDALAIFADNSRHASRWAATLYANARRRSSRWTRPGRGCSYRVRPTAESVSGSGAWPATRSGRPSSPNHSTPPLTSGWSQAAKSGWTGRSSIWPYISYAGQIARIDLGAQRCRSALLALWLSGPPAGIASAGETLRSAPTLFGQQRREPGGTSHGDQGALMVRGLPPG
jgi:hypothetical protein